MQIRTHPKSSFPPSATAEVPTAGTALLVPASTAEALQGAIWLRTNPAEKVVVD